MPSTREMRLRIRSIKNLSQVTKALETVSASKVRRAIQKVEASLPYSEKAWKLVLHIARQPGAASLHPLLQERSETRAVRVIMIAGDRGLAGAYNVNILRHTLAEFRDSASKVDYVAIGRRGRDMIVRRGLDLEAQFTNLPDPPTFADVSAIGRLVVDDYLNGELDQVYICYTRFYNMARQVPETLKLLPLKVEYLPENQHSKTGTHRTNTVFTYEPSPEEILGQIVPRFTALQIYQAILSAQASEHAARMIAMRNATENASELIGALQLEYNKVRQNMITNDMLDIVGGAEALSRPSRA